jgi:hypothetical protein
MRCVAFLLALSFPVAGCRQVAPEAAPQTQPIVAQREPEPAPTEPARTEPAPHEAAPPEAPPRVTQLQPGIGRCSVDEDCVLTSYSEGCCTYNCEPYASNKRDLAAREARENCEAYRSGKKVCPPPAPCPPSTTHARAATCVDRTCTAVVEQLTD